ncbi:MAG: protein-L-isoaspartate O-methyltransferase [Thalassobaculales bacterium]
MTDYAAARHNMVESQIRTNKVTDEALIQALREVPREAFVPKSLKGIAYVDEDLPVAPGRYLMEPMVLARLIQLAGIGRQDTVLDVGCTTGYSVAVMARLAASVVGLEVDHGLAELANATLSQLGVDNGAVVAGALEQGYAKQAPFSVILLNGAVETVPEALTDQLAEGGRLVAVIRSQPGLPGGGIGRATLFVKHAGRVGGRAVFDCATPLLPGFRRQPGFVF